MTENTVVWGYENGAGLFQENGPSMTTYPRINYSHMNGTLREILAGSAQHKCGLGYVLRLDGMTNVNNHSIRIDSKDHPFHSRHIGILDAEISGQGYYSTHLTYSLHWYH